MNNNQDMNVNTQSSNFINNQPYQNNNEVNNNLFNTSNSSQMPNENFINQQVSPQNNSQTINPFTSSSNIDNPVNKGYVEMLKQEGINVQSQSKFINESNFNETSIDDLNINGDYNNLNRIDYSNDPKVMENLGRVEKKEKMTITITKDLKFIIIIALGLFIFILIMPYIFDFFRDINN